MINASDVYKHYGSGPARITALQGVNFTIEAGERVAITGRSGSGKSTLLNLLAGLDRPDSGVLSVDSRRLDKMSRREMAAYRLDTVGMIFQAFQLIPQRTAFQNVELPLILEGQPKAERQDIVADWLQRVGLADRMDHLPHALSGGEQQRVAIARSLVNHPSVVFADEPTGNLDSSTAESIADLLEDLCETEGLTYVLVTHDDELAERRSSRRLTMSDGRLNDRA